MTTFDWDFIDYNSNSNDCNRIDCVFLRYEIRNQFRRISYWESYIKEKKTTQSVLYAKMTDIFYIITDSEDLNVGI